MVFEVAGASSAAVGFASSPLMFADSSHGKFDAYAVAECAIGSPTVNFGQTIGDPEGVRFIDGAFADNSAAAFMVAQMQQDCIERPHLYTCPDNTISIVIVDHSEPWFKQGAMRNLFQYPTSGDMLKVEPGDMLKDYNFVGSRTFMPVIFEDVFDDRQWNAFVADMWSGPATYWKGNLVTLENKWYRVQGGWTVRALLINANIDLPTVYNNDNWGNNAVPEFFKDQYGAAMAPVTEHLTPVLRDFVFGS